MRSAGAVPATIGVLNGVAHVGMSENEMSELAGSAHQKKALKVSRRDLGYICGAVNDLTNHLSFRFSTQKY